MTRMKKSREKLSMQWKAEEKLSTVTAKCTNEEEEEKYYSNK